MGRYSHGLSRHTAPEFVKLIAHNSWPGPVSVFGGLIVESSNELATVAGSGYLLGGSLALLGAAVTTAVSDIWVNQQQTGYMQALDNIQAS